MKKGTETAHEKTKQKNPLNGLNPRFNLIYVWVGVLCLLGALFLTLFTNVLVTGVLALFPNLIAAPIALVIYKLNKKAGSYLSLLLGILGFAFSLFSISVQIITPDGSLEYKPLGAIISVIAACYVCYASYTNIKLISDNAIEEPEPHPIKTIQMCTVNFLVDGEPFRSKKIIIGTTPSKPIVNPEDFETPEYVKKFKYWNGWEDNIIVSEDMNFEAVFEKIPKIYKVTFNIGSKTIESLELEYGKTIPIPKKPEACFNENGILLEFKEWKGYVEGMKVSTNHKFEAVFTDPDNEEDGYRNIVFNIGGKTYSELILKDGEHIELPEKPKPVVTDSEVRIFSHWNGLDSNNPVVKGNMVIDAVFDVKKRPYMVSFTNGDTTVWEDVLPHGSIIRKPGDLKGYRTPQGVRMEFEGWEGYTDGMLVSGNHTFPAVFREIPRHDIRFMVEGAEFRRFKVDDGSIIKTPSKPHPIVRNGQSCEFRRWIGFDETRAVTSDMTFEAEFEIVLESYEVIFKSGERIVSRSTMESGREIVLPSEPEPYRRADGTELYFKKWMGYTQGMRVSGNHVFEAEFTNPENPEDCYRRIVFKVKGATYKTALQKDGDVIEAPLKLPLLKDNQYCKESFQGWTGFTEGMIVSKDVTFEADIQTISLQRDVNFIDRFGTFSRRMTIGEMIYAPSDPKPFIRGEDEVLIEFKYWGGYEPGMVVSEDHTFTAVYTDPDNPEDGYMDVVFRVDEKEYSRRKIRKGKLVEPPSPPKNSDITGYKRTFSHWDGLKEGKTTVSKDVFFDAVFLKTPMRHNIMFKNGNQIVSILELDYGENIPLPDNLPSYRNKDGITIEFKGWKGYTKGLTVSGDCEFTALFTDPNNPEDRYRTITFMVGENEFSRMTLRDGERIKPPSNPPGINGEGYIEQFSHWKEFGVVHIVTKSETFHAVFKKVPLEYMVTFKNMGRTVRRSSYKHGSTIIPPDDPKPYTQNGMIVEFKGWDGYEEGMTVSGEHTFNATYWEPKEKHHIIVFMIDDQEYSKQVLRNGERINAPPKPENIHEAGYTRQFSHWNGLKMPVHIASSDETFHAIFIRMPLKYTVTFEDRGRIVGRSIQDLGRTIIPPVNPKPYRRDDGVLVEFKGWEGYEKGMRVSGNHTFTSIYSDPNEGCRTILFISEEGVFDKMTLKDGKPLVKPSRTPGDLTVGSNRKRFSHWKSFEDGMMVDGDMEFHAVYETITEYYHVTFKNGNREIISSTMKVGEIIVPPPITPIPTRLEDRNMMEFAGWSGFVPGMTVERDHEFTASFRFIGTRIENNSTNRHANYHTVKFMNGESEHQRTMVIPGNIIPLPKRIPGIVKTNNGMWAFDHWEGYSENMVATEDHVFKAVFAPLVAEPAKRQYHVVFRNGSETVCTRTFDEGSIIEFPKTIPVRTDEHGNPMRFIGWNEVEGITVTRNMVIRARFKEIVDTVQLKPPTKQPPVTPKRAPSTTGFNLDLEKIRESEMGLNRAIDLLYVEGSERDYEDVDPDVTESEIEATLVPPQETDVESTEDVWVTLVENLNEEQTRYVRHLLGMSEFDTSETMVNLLEDQINETSNDITGDILIEDGEIIEDYVEEIRRRM